MLYQQHPTVTGWIHRLNDCTGGTFHIVATSATTYRLLLAPSPGVQCSDIPEIQQRWEDISTMLLVTHEYRLEDDELRLLGRQIGHEVEATFVAEAPESGLPNQ